MGEIEWSAFVWLNTELSTMRIMNITLRGLKPLGRRVVFSLQIFRTRHSQSARTVFKETLRLHCYSAGNSVTGCVIGSRQSRSTLIVTWKTLPQTKLKVCQLILPAPLSAAAAQSNSKRCSERTPKFSSNEMILILILNVNF